MLRGGVREKKVGVLEFVEGNIGGAPNKILVPVTQVLFVVPGWGSGTNSGGGAGGCRSARVAVGKDRPWLGAVKFGTGRCGGRVPTSGIGAGISGENGLVSSSSV